jgi:hypothetical protein
MKADTCTKATPLPDPDVSNYSLYLKISPMKDRLMISRVKVNIHYTVRIASDSS